MLIIIVCVILREIVTFFVLYADKDITMKERSFICATWFPKATVQASLSHIFIANA
jgi:hypothetical protein